MLSWFERRLDPFPDTPDDAPTRVPPSRFFAFVWAATRGSRRLLLGMTLLTATIGAFEAILFSVLGQIVDWLAQTPKEQLWSQSSGKLLGLGAILLISPAAVWVQTLIKHQALAGNFPMRLRWRFHQIGRAHV